MKQQIFKLVADSVDKRLSIYTPENLKWHLEMNPWKGDSSWKPPFLVLVFGGCKLTITFLKSPTFSKKLHLVISFASIFSDRNMGKKGGKVDSESRLTFQIEE